MNFPKIPHNEHLRLEELIGLGILDTPPEEKFDRITRIAKSHFKVATSLVTMIDADRQWFKSRQGWDIKETSREISFCAHAILQDDIFIVENANLDARFQENPLVTGSPYFQFYAGVPLHGPNGLLIGTLCIFDTEPRSMSSDDIATLNELAVLVELSLGIARLSQMAMQTKKSEAKLSAIWNNIVDGIITIDTAGNIESVNQAGLNMFGYLENELLGGNISMLMPSSFQGQYGTDWHRQMESASSEIVGLEREVTGKRKSGSTFPMELSISEMWIEGTRYYINIVRDISSRVETMNALMSSEKRWKFAIEGAGDGVWDWDVQTNTVVYSKRWKEMLGHSEEEIGSSAEEWSSRVHPDDMPRLSQIIQNHLEGKVPYFTDEHRFKCKDGSWLWIHDRGLVVSRDEQGNPLRVVGTHTDISERKKAEFLIKDTMEKLSHAKELLQTTINNVPALVAYWDDQLINRFANSAYFDWFGFTPAQMYGKHIREIIGNVRFEEIRDKLTSVLKGNVEVFERTINDRSGIKRHTVFSYTPEIRNGVVRGCYGFLSDITPLKEAQLDKEKALSQLQSTFDAASEFSIITTNLEGIIIGFSAGAERMLGYDAKDMIGMQTPMCFHLTSEVEIRSNEFFVVEDKKIEGFSVFVHSAKQGKAETREWTYVHQNGKHIPVQLTVTSIINEEGDITGYLGIAKDITLEKKAFEVMHLALERAETANRSKSEFVANMSHEIRTPMNAVLGIAHLLGTTPLTFDQKKYVSMIQSSGQSLLNILNDILDFSKIEAGKMDINPISFRLNDIINTVASIMSVYVGDKDLELAIGIEPNVPQFLFGDSLRIQQILINLVGNAIKFTEKGEVSLLVEEVEHIENISKIRFSIRDTGIGIDDEKMSRLFSAFTQADTSTTRKFGGTGLGLTISKQLAEMMNGAIQVESMLDVGSKFSFTVPLKQEGGVNDMHDYSHFMKNLKILVIDNNETSREFLAKNIRLWHWRPECVASGRSAIELITANITSDCPYDAILVDWEMPDQSGVEVIQSLRRTFPQYDIPLILMAGAYSRVRLMQEENVYLADAILQKPITASDLFDAIHQIRVQKYGDIHSTPDPEHQPHYLRLEGITILLVEDNVLNQFVTKSMLEGAGITIHIAQNGKEAVDFLKNNAEEIDIILMDVQMPVMDGFAATNIIRHELHLTLPIIAMSAGVMESEKNACIKAGMNDFVGKPIDLDKLLSTIYKNINGTSKEPMSTIVNMEVELKPDIEKTHQINTDQIQAFNPQRLISLTQKSTESRDAIFSAMQRIIENSPAQMAEAKTNFLQGDLNTSMQILHNMRGALGTIGAKYFSENALELEMAIRAENVADINELFTKTEHSLSNALCMAKDWLSVQYSATGQEKSQANSLNLKETIELLISQLRQNNISACDTFSQNRHLLINMLSSEDIQHVGSSIESLDFESALLILNQLHL